MTPQMQTFMETHHPMSADESARAFEQFNEIPFAAEPLLNVRAKTQIVVDGVLRYMGEQWQMPEREALGLIGGGEAEQFTDDFDAPLWWTQNAPGPREGPGGNYLPGSIGSRELPVNAGARWPSKGLATAVASCGVRVASTTPSTTGTNKTAPASQRTGWRRRRSVTPG